MGYGGAEMGREAPVKRLDIRLPVFLDGEAAHQGEAPPVLDLTRERHEAGPEVGQGEVGLADLNHGETALTSGGERRRELGPVGG
jgi:hypothetical protein